MYTLCVSDYLLKSVCQVSSPLHLNAFEIWFLYERKEGERHEKINLNFRVPEYQSTSSTLKLCCPILFFFCHLCIWFFVISCPTWICTIFTCSYEALRLLVKSLKMSKVKEEREKKTESRGMVVDSLASFALVCCWDLTLSLLNSNDTCIGSRGFGGQASGADCLQFCISQPSHGSPLSQFFITSLTFLGVFHKDATMWLGGGKFLSLSCEEYDSL